jgi:hypothetical protein
MTARRTSLVAGHRVLAEEVLRQPPSQHDEHSQGDRARYPRGESARDDAEDQGDDRRHGQAKQQKFYASGPVAALHWAILLVMTEQHPVHRYGCQEKPGGGDGEGYCHEVDAALVVEQAFEPAAAAD